jgi:hypothetical protein
MTLSSTRKNFSEYPSAVLNSSLRSYEDMEVNGTKDAPQYLFFPVLGRRKSTGSENFMLKKVTSYKISPDFNFTDKGRIWIRSWIRLRNFWEKITGSGSVPKSHGSGTLKSQQINGSCSVDMFIV